MLGAQQATTIAIGADRSVRHRCGSRKIWQLVWRRGRRGGSQPFAIDYVREKGEQCWPLEGDVAPLPGDLLIEHRGRVLQHLYMAIYQLKVLAMMRSGDCSGESYSSAMLFVIPESVRASPRKFIIR